VLAHTGLVPRKREPNHIPARLTPGASPGITDSREATALTRRCHTPHLVFEDMDLGPIIRVNPTAVPLTPGASPGITSAGRSGWEDPRVDETARISLTRALRGRARP
jgi:hypothetical protein